MKLYISEDDSQVAPAQHLTKLNVLSRTEAISVASRRGLVQLCGPAHEKPLRTNRIRRLPRHPASAFRDDSNRRPALT
jgi:hypothetical protein